MLSPEEVERFQKRSMQICHSLESRIFGQEKLIKLVTVACLAGGHVLLEGLPGLGKTELVKSLAEIAGLQFRRIQFTPDLLPSDITGAPVLEESDGRRKMVFQPGPLFGNIILADEINRASPRTQAAMLEAMQEARVTAYGQTYDLPTPFWTLATQNPIDLEGTYPLPEAQLDRFMFKLHVHRVEAEVLQKIILRISQTSGDAPIPRLSEDDLRELLSVVREIFLPPAVAAYISRLVDATHPDSRLAPAIVKEFVRYGASPRAALAIARAAKAHALLDGKPNVGFVDVEAVLVPALQHRIHLQYQARLEKVQVSHIIAALQQQVQPVQSASK